MDCHLLREALVDYARGVLSGAGSIAALESHLEHCPDCAAEDARQAALTVVLRAVAEGSAREAASDALERKLLEAFTAELTTRVAGIAAGPARPVPRWLAIAASLVVVAGGLYGMVRLKPDAATAGVGLMTDTTTTASVPLKPDATTAEVRGKPDATTTSEIQPKLADLGNRRSPAPRPSRSTDEFMPLPGAIGLPAFESGRIVRVDLPVSSLPAYGVELVPYAARTEVQADVLVGQDGQARAIRLVEADSGSR